MGIPPEEKKQAPNRIEAWRKKHRLQVQSAALVLALTLPFVLYWALNSDHVILAAACFAMLALSMAGVAWAG